MSRIRLEEKLLRDSRFIAVELKIGKTEALGCFVRIVFLAKHYWLQKKRLIPKKIYKDQKFPNEFIEYDLVEEREDGYYVRGSNEHFKFLFQRSEKSAQIGELVKEKNSTTRAKKVELPFLDSELQDFIYGVSDRIRYRWLKDYRQETIETYIERAMLWCNEKGKIPKNVGLLMNKFFEGVPKDNKDDCPLDESTIAALDNLGGD